MFFVSLITPLIVLILYGTFLWKVYEDSFLASVQGFGQSVDTRLLKGCVGGELLSSLLAVSCVTVAFCANMLMVQDKITGARKDLTISPVSSAVLSGSYFLGTAISSLLVCFTALALCLGYVQTVGWFFSGKDILLLSADVVLLVLFGTALSSMIHFFLSTQGQISAVGTLVSAGYGFLCGAYMPISSFGSGLQKVLSFLPSTYMTSLVRNHVMRGVLVQMEAEGIPKAFVDVTRESLDCTVKFAGKTVTIPAMYAYVGGMVLVLLGAYLAVQYLAERKRVHS